MRFSLVLLLACLMCALIVSVRGLEQADEQESPTPTNFVPIDAESISGIKLNEQEMKDMHAEHADIRSQLAERRKAHLEEIRHRAGNIKGRNMDHMDPHHSEHGFHNRKAKKQE